MADPSRFPQLAFPFAVVGACAGWLSVRMLQNPVVDLLRHGDPNVAALLAMGAGTVTGALLTRLCVGKRYVYELDTPNPDLRPHSDAWPLHIGAVLAAGSLTGALYLLILQYSWDPALGAFGGTLCGAAFLPVCMTVLGFARRAQRARLGSLVAGSDRRAVWSILAITLALATLEVILDWPAADRVGAPLPALGMVLGAGIVVALLRALDSAALRRVRAASTPDFERRQRGELEGVGESVPRVDLGLGDELRARFARSASAYRGSDRLAALLEGSPEQAIGALRRAVRRGTLGLVTIGLLTALHLLSGTEAARLRYDAYQCESASRARCDVIAARERASDPQRARALFARGCERYQRASCLPLADMYLHGEGGPWDDEAASRAYTQACYGSDAESCRRAADLLSRGAIDHDDRELRLLDRGCTLGDLPSCDRLASKQAP